MADNEQKTTDPENDFPLIHDKTLPVNRENLGLPERAKPE